MKQLEPIKDALGEIVNNDEWPFQHAKAREALATLQELKKTHVLVPIEGSSDWFLDYWDNKPFTLKEIHGGFVVLENYNNDYKAGKGTLEETVFCQKFHDREAALFCYKSKTAEYLRAQMIAASEGDDD